MDQQAHAFRRQGDAAAFPFEQAGVQQAFQLLDMPGDGRLRDEQLSAARVKFRRRATVSNTFSRKSVIMEKACIQPRLRVPGKLLSFMRLPR